MTEQKCDYLCPNCEKWVKIKPKYTYSELVSGEWGVMGIDKEWHHYECPECGHKWNEEITCEHYKKLVNKHYVK